MSSSGSLCGRSTLVERVRGILESLPRESLAGWAEPLLRTASDARRDLSEIRHRLARFRAECPDLLPVEEGPLLVRARELLGDEDRPRYAGRSRILPRD